MLSFIEGSVRAEGAEEDMMMTTRNVLVVGAEENPILPILESLSNAGVNVSVGSHRKCSLGFFSRFTHKRFLYPSPYSEPDQFLESALNILRKEAFEVMFVLGDRATDLVSKHKEQFIPFTRIPLVDFERYTLCRDKTRTMKIAEDLGIPIPKTYYPQEVDIAAIARCVDYPVVLKPNSSDGARGISFPSTPIELLNSYHATVNQFGPCHVQEYIPQTGMQYKAEFLLDYTGEIKGWCVYNKLRYYPITGGSSALNSTVDRKDILELGAKILKELKWYGMGDCDFIEDPRDGKVKLMEINPRFTRSIKICVRAGVDFPLLMYKLAMKETVPAMLDYKVGLYLRYLPSDMMWFLRSENRFKAKPSFFRFFNRNTVDEIFSMNDPGPALAYFLSKGSNLLNKRERQYCLGKS